MNLIIDGVKIFFLFGVSFLFLLPRESSLCVFLLLLYLCFVLLAGCLCKELQSQSRNNNDSKAFKALLVTLKATALNLSKIFKYAEGE